MLFKSRSSAFLALPAAAAFVAVAFFAAPAGAVTIDRAGLKLTFADDFNTFDWDEAYHGAGEKKGAWRTSYKNSSDKNDINNRSLPGNNELQAYLDKAFPSAGESSLGVHPFEILEGGVLRITANPAPQAMREQIWGRTYTSGVISTWGSFAQRYGVFEMRARLPKGKALWPAFWLMPRDGGWPTEIDIMEVIGQKPDEVWSALHSGATGKHTGAGLAANVGDVSTGFHTYMVDWGPKRCIFYFDGREIFRYATPADANKAMYLIINLAVGGKWPGKPDKTTTFPAHMDIDYVRVWQRAAYENAPDPEGWPKTTGVTNTLPNPPARR